MTRLTRRALVGASLSLAAGAAHAESWPRFALIIANSDYDGDGKVETSDAARQRAAERGFVGDLANPWFDAVRVGDALRSAGFETETAFNADRGMMSGSVMRLFARAKAAGPGASTLSYYAGHGIQLSGRPFLVATRAQFLAEGMPADTAEQRTQIGLRLGVSVPELIIGAPRPEPPGFNLFLIDACRDNPWEDQVRAGLEAEGRAYVGERGFGAMSVLTPRTVLAFSTSPGEEAVDGIAAAGSPYAAAIIQRLRQPGLSVDAAVDSMLGEVSATSGGRQTPWRIGRVGDATPLAKGF